MVAQGVHAPEESRLWSGGGGGSLAILYSSVKNIQPRQDFPGGPVVKNLPCNAGDMGSIPGRGPKIPHAMGQLSRRATTRDKPTHHNKDPACPN